MATKVVSRSVATAMAISSRAARACDVCASKSARWYCGADAAYLCDRCDTQVHSANSLAQRHERVRLTPTGAPMMKLETKATAAAATKKKKNLPPSVLQPARKRSRSSRPHPHRRPVVEEMKDEDVGSLSADFFDTEEFLVDDTHEVPSFASSPSGSYSGSEASLSPELPDSFAAYFKGKAAHDEFLVPDGFDSGIDIICCDADGNISLAGEACFVPGDIPGLDAFDDCSLGFNLAQRGLTVDAFEGEKTTTSATTTSSPVDEFSNGPFAKYFVKRKVAEKKEVKMSAEVIKSEAKEILRCCLEGESERAVPALRLNYEEVITAWSNRGEPWVNPGDSATDVGLVPDMDHDADEGHREARVLRYKEKKRSRLFSKTIRYEVRKLNAERRPRMKGRFVKRTN